MASVYGNGDTRPHLEAGVRVIEFCLRLSLADMLQDGLNAEG